MFAGIQTKLIIFGVLTMVLFGGYMYIQTLRAELAQAAEVRAKLESVIEQQKLIAEQTTKDIANMQRLNDNLSRTFADAEKETTELKKKFHNLETLAEKKPKLIENSINKGTKFAIRCNELATGALVTESDRGNNICPNLIGKIGSIK